MARPLQFRRNYARTARASLALLVMLSIIVPAASPRNALAAGRDIPAEVASELMNVAGTQHSSRLAFGGTPERPEIVWVFEGRNLDAAALAKVGRVNLGVMLSFEELGEAPHPTASAPMAPAPTTSTPMASVPTGSVVMDFEAPGALPGLATVSLVVPETFVGAELKLYELDESAGAYRLLRGGLFASDGYVTFALDELRLLVVSAGMPTHLPAAYGGLAASVSGGSTSVSSSGSTSGSTNGMTNEQTNEQTAGSTSEQTAGSTSESNTPPNSLPLVAFVAALAALGGTSIGVFARRRRATALQSMQKMFQGGSFKLEDLPGLEEVMGGIDQPKPTAA